MNKYKKLVFAFFICTSIMNSKCMLYNSVHASGLLPNPQNSAYNSDENIFTKYGYKGQCTWFTYGRVLEKLGISLPSEFYGNAVDWWYANAKDNIYAYGSEPKPNSIVVWGGGNYGYGHVGFVEKVEGDTVYFNEGNFSIRGAYDGDIKALSTKEIKTRGNLYLKGYIYITDKNSKTDTSKSSTSGSGQASQASTVTEKTIDKGYVNISSSTSTLNVRSSGSATSSIIGSLKKGESVNIVAKSGDWYKIQYNSSYGYVNLKYINSSTSNVSSTTPQVQALSTNTTSIVSTTKPTTTSTTSKSGVVTLTDKSSSLNLRSNPTGEVLKTLSNGTKVEILDSSGSWYKINANGSIGYVLSAYISSSEPTKTSSETTKANSQTTANSKVTSTSTSKVGIVSLSDTSSTLNLRNSPWTGRIVSTLSCGSKVEIIENNGRWYKVKAGSEVGYVHSDYIKV